MNQTSVQFPHPINGVTVDEINTLISAAAISNFILTQVLCVNNGQIIIVANRLLTLNEKSQLKTAFQNIYPIITDITS